MQKKKENGTDAETRAEFGVDEFAGRRADARAVVRADEFADARAESVTAPAGRPVYRG